MKELYFVRHGESLWNLEDKICGATDAPLTEKGREQAVKTGKVIAESGIRADMILYSPLQRVGVAGIEPTYTESKSVVLPLYYTPI